jgi:CRISPR-associated exonuclease Cas4
MDTPAEQIMISAIAHYAYCPRRCALIHIEGQFEENVYTLRGSGLHRRADTVSWSMEGTTRLERALPIWSERLGIYGRADVVEFHANGAIVPVEYKHGTKGRSRHDDLQLCAQALCLEEMFGGMISRGAVFHHKTRRRRDVPFTEELRKDLESIVGAMRDMIRVNRTPSALYDSRCPNCSMNGVCMPEALSAARERWHARQLYVVQGEHEEESTGANPGR